MPKYDIVSNRSREALEVVDGTWHDVQICILKHNKLGHGVFARKSKESGNLTPLRAPQSILEADAKYVFVDAWTSGNPGIGGCRGVDENGRVLFERKSEKIHTNNFFELYAIYAGLLYIFGDPKKYPVGNKCFLYTDSQTAMSWIRNKKHNAARDQESISKLIELINNDLAGNGWIELKKWDTEKYGEIPADYGRK